MMPRPALRSRLRNLKQENPMNVNHYIGFDVHKKSVSYCVKTGDGRIVEEGKLPATRQALRQWAQQRTEPWHGAMEATLFSGWIYDALKPYAAELQMGHPAMMKAIGASKKKNDRLDARKTADLVRCNLLPACYVAPVEIRELRRLLRYRNVVVAQAVRMKNKMSGLLMEVGAPYNKQRLHGKQYFSELLDQLEEVPESVKDLLRRKRLMNTNGQQHWVLSAESGANRRSDQAREGVQRCGSSSSSRVMGCAAMRKSTSWNQANGSTFASSQDATKLRRTAAVLPPRSLPKNVQLLRPTAQPRSARSVWLLSIDRSGSAQYCVSAVQFFRM